MNDIGGGPGATSPVRRGWNVGQKLFDRAKHWVSDRLPQKPVIQPDHNTASGAARYAGYAPERPADVDFGAGRAGRIAGFGGGRSGTVSAYGGGRSGATSAFGSDEGVTVKEQELKKRGHLSDAKEDRANATGDDKIFMVRARMQAEHMRVPVDPEHRKTFDKLDPEAKEDFRRLSSYARQQYVDLDKTLADQPEARKSLQGVLSSGNLAHPGMLDSLQQMAKGPLAPELAGLDGKQLLATHLRQLNMEGAVYQGESNFCGPAAAQEAMIHQDPAAYSQMVADLVTKGKATMPDGETLKVDMDSFKAAKAESSSKQDQRSDLDSVLLSSLHSYARKAFPEKGKGPDDPLSAEQIAKLMGSTLPKNTTLELDGSKASQDAAMDLIVKSLKENDSVPVGITVDRNGRPDADGVTGHMITLTGVDQGPDGKVKGLEFASGGRLYKIEGAELEDFKKSLALITAPKYAKHGKALDEVVSDGDFGGGRLASGPRLG